MKRYQRHEQYIWARCDGNMFLKCRLGWLDDMGNAGFWRRKSGWKIPVVLWFYPNADWRCKNLRLGHQTTQLTLSLPLTLTPFRETERERERDRQTDTHTQRYRHTHTCAFRWALIPKCSTLTSCWGVVPLTRHRLPLVQKVWTQWSIGWVFAAVKEWRNVFLKVGEPGHYPVASGTEVVPLPYASSSTIPYVQEIIIAAIATQLVHCLRTVIRQMHTR